MDIKDVKVGMRVKSASNVGEIGDGYVSPNTYGSVEKVENKSILVKWDNSCGGDDDRWWINPEYTEPAYKKSEMVGNYIRVLRDDEGVLEVGDVLEIYLDSCKDITVSNDEGDYSSWSYHLPTEFTQSDLKNLYDGETDFEYVLKEDIEKSKPQIKTEPNVKVEIPAIKINVDSSWGIVTKDWDDYLQKLTNEIKSDNVKLSNKPIIEDSKDELIIYCGKNTIYYNKQLDILGMSQCHKDDTYSQLIGLAIAHYRAYHKGDK